MIITKKDKRLKAILNREVPEKFHEIVKEVMDDVKKRGDTALFHYTKTLDSYNGEIEIPKSKFASCYKSISKGLRKALVLAAERIESYCKHQMDKIEKTWLFEDKDGVMLGQIVVPLRRVGVYVPGGKAAYPSSVLMNVIPAKVAGVKEVVIATPTPGGVINEAVLAAAHIAGADRIFRIGGAQAVAAFAYGTKSIPKADKIVGPGNIYVALAKKFAFGDTGIDMIAGPSEILVIADESASASWTAMDMLSQAEHDELARSICITPSRDFAQSVEEELVKQVKLLKRRAIAEKSLKNACIVLVKDLNEACRLSNEIAPEHLELCVENPMLLLKNIKNAGAVFLGNYSPEACGDYFAGPSHVLPTGGTAKFFSPLGVYDFVKRTSLIYYSQKGLLKHAESIETLAEAEGLQAHAQSVRMRRKLSVKK